jgi:transcriptional regulator with XRE-family HTH domain
MDKQVRRQGQVVLGALLRGLRQQAGLRQQDLAARLGQPQSFVSKYESGERRLDVVELRCVCEALGRSMVEVVQELEQRLAGGKSAT